MRSKAWRARCVTNNPAQIERNSILNWAAMPMDHLLLRLQWLDERGDSLLDICSPSTSVLVQTQKALRSSLAGAVNTGTFRSVIAQFGQDPHHRTNLLRRARNMVLRMGCELWYRTRCTCALTRISCCGLCIRTVAMACRCASSFSKRTGAALTTASLGKCGTSSRLVSRCMRPNHSGKICEFWHTEDGSPTCTWRDCSPR